VFPEPDRPRPPPSSTRTATATFGESAGAKPVNHRVYGSSAPFWAVPVLPATSTPLILAFDATPLWTSSIIIRVMVAAVSFEIGSAKRLGEKPDSSLRSGLRTLSTTLGFMTSPPLAMPAVTMAVCSGVARTSSWPKADCAVCASSRSGEKTLFALDMGTSIDLP
jgi:hypothetical protein